MIRVAAAITGLVLALAGCGSSGPSSAPSGPSSGPDGPPSDSVGLGTPSPSGSGGSTSVPVPVPTATLPPVTHRVSLPALMRASYDGGRLRIVRRIAVTEAYTRWEVTYRSGDLTISGVLLRPHGQGPFPGVVLAHGHIEPSIYVTGQGLAREQDRLAREGFVVLHTDYRGHADSDPAGPIDVETRLGYARDTINAVRTLRRLPYVDGDRLALLGRSMGGGVVQDVLVAQPGLVKAAVVYASVSSSFLDNLRRWTLPERPEAAEALFDRFGTPRADPGFYRGLSPRTYFDRITEPVLMFHGTSDDSCPVAWSRTTYRLLRRAGVDARLVIYPGEEHAFIPRWEDSIRTTVRFLRRHLDV